MADVMTETPVSGGKRIFVVLVFDNYSERNLQSDYRELIQNYKRSNR